MNIFLEFYIGAFIGSIIVIGLFWYLDTTFGTDFLKDGAY